MADSCRNICTTKPGLKAPAPRGGYITPEIRNAVRRCTTCAISVFVEKLKDGIRCPCCNMVTRRFPRNYSSDTIEKMYGIEVKRI